MKICFVADIRSPTAQNWISYFVEAGHQVNVLASYPYDSEGLEGSVTRASILVLPIALTGVLGWGSRESAAMSGMSMKLLNKIRGGTLARLVTFSRHWLGPIQLRAQVGKLREYVSELSPDLIHAMRIPFEGIFASFADQGTPLLISTWGNDLTLWAKRYPLTALLTRRALRRADAVHSDCHRDARLVLNWGFRSSRPILVAPGAGGVQREIFFPGNASSEFCRRLDVSPDVPIVVNPRGPRSYVRNESFFRAIPRVLRNRPDAVFLAPAMMGNSDAEAWRRRLDVNDSLRLLPPLTRREMAQIFRLSTVTVSLGEYDGTPNSLLEAIACGSFPVVGDIESLSEWIQPGINGHFCRLDDPDSLAAAILDAISNQDLRKRAESYNEKLVEERADYNRVMPLAEQFYERLTARNPT